MYKRTLLLLFFGALIIAVIAGCAPKADLVAVKLPDWGTDPIAYCNLNDDGSLIVTVKNQGTGDAPASVTRVTFTSLVSGDIVVDLPTPALTSGSSYDLDPIDLEAFPANCYQPDCVFTITIDSTNVADESNEENNSAGGYCIG